MNNYNAFYWLGIVGGNACYIILLLALGGAMKRKGIRKVCYALLMAGMAIGFILLDPFSKEIKLPGIASGDYGVFDIGVRIAIGLAGLVTPIAFNWIYLLCVFNLQIYQIKRKKKNKFYTYQTFYFISNIGFWCLWMRSSLLFLSAVEGHYKTSWEGIFGVLLGIYYIGGICMAVLRQLTFEVEDGHFKYKGLNKTCEGVLEDIEAAERTKKGIILYVNGEKLFIGCQMEELRDLLKDKMINADDAEKEREEVNI